MDIRDLGFLDGQREGRAAIRARPLRSIHPPKVEHHQQLAENYGLEALAQRFKETYAVGEVWTWQQADHQTYLAGYKEGFLMTYAPAMASPTWRDVGADLRYIARGVIKGIVAWRPHVSPAQSTLIAGIVIFLTMIGLLWVIVTHVPAPR